jgi:hypothetical protein
MIVVVLSISQSLRTRFQGPFANSHARSCSHWIYSCIVKLFKVAYKPYLQILGPIPPPKKLHVQNPIKFGAQNDFPPSEDEIGNSPASFMVGKRRAWGWRRGESVVLKH